MTPRTHNLLDGFPSTIEEEFVQTLAESDAIRIERIVSDGHATMQGEWYDQEWDEWVLLVSGGAALLFDDDAAPLVMRPGDHIMIPARRRHRVEWTDAAQKTIWLAVHFDGSRMK